jgi:hypothetical protein
MVPAQTANGLAGLPFSLGRDRARVDYNSVIELSIFYL